VSIFSSPEFEVALFPKDGVSAEICQTKQVLVSASSKPLHMMVQGVSERFYVCLNFHTCGILSLPDADK